MNKLLISFFYYLVIKFFYISLNLVILIEFWLKNKKQKITILKIEKIKIPKINYF